MKVLNPHRATLNGCLLVGLVMFCASSRAATDADAATAMLKKSECLKCHAIDKDKKAPSFRNISDKWRGKADAEAKLIECLTKAPRVKHRDGTLERHKLIATTNMSEIRNLVAWIQSQ
ncbi:MAG: c-type cytochrome [Rhodoferax sp.]